MAKIKNIVSSFFNPLVIVFGYAKNKEVPVEFWHAWIVLAMLWFVVGIIWLFQDGGIITGAVCFAAADHGPGGLAVLYAL